MLNEFMALLAKSEVVLVGERPYKARWQVVEMPGISAVSVRLTWANTQNEDVSLHLTEEGLQAGIFNRRTKAFEFDDEHGQPLTIKLLSNGQHLGLPESVEAAPSVPMFVFVCSPGTGNSRLRAHRTRAAADADRQACASSSVPTSPVVAVPATLAAHPDFYAVVEQLLKAAISAEETG